MLIDLKDRIDDPDVRELLEYSMFDDPDKVDKALKEYRNGPPVQLYGLETVDRLVGMVGFRKLGSSELEIRHLSVFPESRRKGYGALLIKELGKLMRPEMMSAETDDDAVDFYRNIGFRVISLAERYLGSERYRCEFDWTSHKDD